VDRESQVVGYVRVSTQEQVGGFGLDVQRSAIERYCAEHGLKLVRIAEDAGISGSNGLDTRQGLSEALVMIENHQVSTLVVYRLDRLARDLLIQETVMGRIRQAGGQIVSVSEPDIDSDDPTRVLVRQVLGAISQYEKAVIRGRMVAGRRAAIAAGRWGGGTRPFGFAGSDGRLDPLPEEQRVIAIARDLRAHGRSLREIADLLNRDGHRTKRGREWHAQQVARVL
jgi:DNA invertase Pin-like site-specific DNA recombinase